MWNLKLNIRVGNNTLLKLNVENFRDKNRSNTRLHWNLLNESWNLFLVLSALSDNPKVSIWSNSLLKVKVLRNRSKYHHQVFTFYWQPTLTFQFMNEIEEYLREFWTIIIDDTKVQFLGIIYIRAERDLIRKTWCIVDIIAIIIVTVMDIVIAIAAACHHTIVEEVDVASLISSKTNFNDTFLHSKS